MSKYRNPIIWYIAAMCTFFSQPSVAQDRLSLSEAVMLELGAFVGRQLAHEVVYEASMAAYEQERPLRDLLLEDTRITRHLSADKLDELLQPERYTGLCGEFVDRVAGKSG